MSRGAGRRVVVVFVVVGAANGIEGCAGVEEVDGNVAALPLGGGGGLLRLPGFVFGGEAGVSLGVGRDTLETSDLAMGGLGDLELATGAAGQLGDEPRHAGNGGWQGWCGIGLIGSGCCGK
ncbi:MAG: hypothetical protein ACXWQZ_17065, partial [Ktedonobacterales bacterium]